MDVNVMRKDIRTAMDNQGITMKDIAAKAGTSLSTISCILSGKATAREERWRMMCEAVGLDFGKYIGWADEAPSVRRQAVDTSSAAAATAPPQGEAMGGAGNMPYEPPAHMIREGALYTAPNTENAESAENDADSDREGQMLLAKYAARHLAEELRSGVDMRLEELYMLLKAMRDAIHEE